MEAKDTVIKRRDCKYQPDGDKDELWVDIGAVYRDKYMEGARNQAEISFKAGIKEVVEWIREHGNQEASYTGDLHMTRSWIELSIGAWEAKLKEWGVD